MRPAARRPIFSRVGSLAAMPETGWWRFAAWVLAGAFTLFAWMTGFSIGLFLLPVAVLVIWLVARGGRIWPEILGSIGGIGVVGILIAALNHDYRACPAGPGTLPPGETSLTCGGTDPKPWLAGGLVLVALAPILYAVARRRIVKTR